MKILLLLLLIGCSTNSVIKCETISRVTMLGLQLTELNCKVPEQLICKEKTEISGNKIRCFRRKRI